MEHWANRVLAVPANCRYPGGTAMNEHAVPKLFGFSLATIFLGMLILNAISY
jgi:hypothetical protein